MADGTIKVTGLREFQRALAKADPVLKKQVREAFREVGDLVRRDAASRFAHIDTGSAGGFKVRVRQRGIAVEQSKRRVTGQRGDYGAMQMRRALLPALGENSNELDQELDRAIDKVADIVEG